jgi:hypothetical protein
MGKIRCNGSYVFYFGSITGSWWITIIFLFCIVDMAERRVEKIRRWNGPSNAKLDGIAKGYSGEVLKDYCNMQYKHLRGYLRGDKQFYHHKVILGVEEVWEE